MTRKRHIFDSPRVVGTPDPVGKPKVAFQSTEIVALVGANVSMLIFWESISAGLATLTTTPTGLSGVSDLNLASGNATWSLTNVQLSNNGQVQADISDAGGSALDAFQLVVQAAPTISVADNDVDVETGQTGLNVITWGDADASVDKPIASITTNAGSVDSISDKTLTSGTARWINPSSAILDSAIATIWITDADGLVTSTQFVFTVTPAPGGVPTVVVEPFSVELPLGSEAVLNFSTQDAETSLAKPMTAFAIIDGVTDISADGVFSPLPAQVTAPTAVSVGWSTTVQQLVDDGKVYEVRATDFDANVGSGATEVVFNVVDPLKTLTDHPVHRTSSYTASISATATDPLRQLAGHPDPGVSIWTTPTNSTWTTSGVLLGGEGDSLVTTMTAGASTQGTYTMRMRVDLNDFDTSVHLRATKNGTIIDNDYSFTGPTDLPAGNQLNIESFPIDLVAGDTLELELWTEYYNGAQILPEPADANKAIVSIMDLSTTSDSEFPATGGTVLWDWEADTRTGRFTGPDQATYQVAYDALPLDPGGTGRPKPTSQVRGPDVGTGQIEFVFNWEVPIMQVGDFTRTFRELEQLTPPDGHCMWRLRMTGGPSQYVENSSYLKSDQDYQFETKFDLVGRDDAIGEARLMAWGILWQLHPSAFPTTPHDWDGNPIFSLQIDDSQPEHIYRLWVRGSTNPDPTTVSDYDSKLSFDFPFWSGPQHVVFEYRPGWQGIDTYARLWINGRKVVDVENIPIGLNFSGLGGVGNDSSQITIGSYGWGLKSGDPPQWLVDGRPDLRWHKIKLKGF